MDATVSVIIPAHRWNELLAEAIQSAMQQSVAPLEIIVANDGAGDAINAPLRARFPQVKIVDMAVNQGEAAARNSGTAAATGDWIAYLDADDLWLPDKLEKQLRALQQHPHWDGCYTGVTMFSQQGDIATYCDKPSPLSVNDLLICTHALPSSLLLRRADVMALDGFDPGLPNATDQDFLLRYVLGGKQLGLVAEPLLRFRRAGQGNISANWWPVLKGKTRLFRKHRDSFFRYGGWRAPLRFFGHVFGECAAKTPRRLLRHLLWSIAKLLLWCGGVNWRQQLREQAASGEKSASRSTP